MSLIAVALRLCQGRTLAFLSLLDLHTLVESSMVGFFLSLLGMDQCKKQLSKKPKYRLPYGGKVSAKGLFQALLADVVAEAFVVDLAQCDTQRRHDIGTRPSILCANLQYGARLRKVLRPILRLVANNEWLRAMRKASRFAVDFLRAAVTLEDMQSAQASAKTHAAMMVSLRESFRA